MICSSSNSIIVPLFEKMLSASDAGRIGRLVLPKACAEVSLLEFALKFYVQCCHFIQTLMKLFLTIYLMSLVISQLELNEEIIVQTYFPPISQPEGLPLRIQDVKGKEWVFQFRFWPNNNSRMYVLEGVTPCIQSMQLQAGDTGMFYCALLNSLT